MITLTLETLSSGQIRATIRHDGATVTYKEGTLAQGRELCFAVLREGASEHQINGDKFDFTWINLNNAAKQAIND